MTYGSKTSIGADMNYESILIAETVTDEDGSLKIKRLEEFSDSKVELDFIQTVAAAGIKKQ
jgi:hypothetical protein